MEYFDPFARPWKQFTVPSGLLGTLQNASRGAPLLQLPMEILIAIFEEVDDVDQLALAVSCKHLLQLSTLVSLKTSIWAGRLVSPHRMMDVLVRLLSPTTNAWKICTICTLYRPTREKYWKAKAVLQGWDVVKAGKEVPMTGGINEWKYNKNATVCPDCALPTLPNACTVAPLLQLPTEILITIFDEVNLIDQLCLALSCKRLLQVSTMVSLDVSDPDALSLYYRLGPTSKDWRFCFGCTQYRPTRESYWKAKANLGNWAEAKDKQDDMMAIIQDWEHLQTMFYCPECLAKMRCLS
ncbi:hypothetical protein V499_02776 [Pseudogymnoascus sp. VKM F-103]|nr:hypothetical protein V499_02776 [Pseudogymnoascus sp. VKM F-103]